MAAATDDTESLLAWERRQKPRAAVAAALAGVLTLGADVYSSSAFRGAPSTGVLESLRSAAQPGAIGTRPSARIRFFEFYDAHAGALVTGSVIRALGYLALGWALTFLAAATRSRAERFPRAVVYAPAVGAVLQAASIVLGTLGSTSAVRHFLAGPRTVDAASDLSGGSLLVTAQIIGLVSSLALAAGIVLVCMNAMRAGLLTRFMGVLGIIVGILAIVPIGPLPVVQAFWLVALAALLLGRWPNGVPPAWRTGRAEPWPSQAEMAQQRREAMDARRAARGGGRPGGAVAAGAAEPDGEPEVAMAAPPRPAETPGQRRKRKRRS